ncbi:MAG: alpha/beta hydrolase [Thermoanaerobaculia bacterium]|jgi:pimeloyl-ACP methyl ester carboxylesterase
MSVLENTLSAEPILGHRLHGRGEDKVLVLHDWMGDAANFEPLLPYLDPEIFTLAFVDLRGYGLSRDIAGLYTAEEVAADAFRLADSLGWKRFHVVGHSMCGMVVQRMALDDWNVSSGRLKSVIAITPVSAGGYPADLATKDFLWSLIGERELSQQGFSLLTGQRLSGRWETVKTDRHLATASTAALKGYFQMWLETDFSAEARSASIQTPMLVIGGRQDLPGFQEEHLRSTFGAWYPHIEFEFITDAGHYPMQETPVYLASLLERFITKHA